MALRHQFTIRTRWTGNRGSGTSGYREYSRAGVVVGTDKAHEISTSSARAFHGDPEFWNPEELLLAALSQCHMLSYLHVAASRGIIVTEYLDSPSATLVQDGQAGAVVAAILRPEVTIASQADVTDGEVIAIAIAMHETASDFCFIAASVNFPISCEPLVRLA